MTFLTFAKFREVNAARCARWHAGGINSWSPSDWGVALAGEAGEACDAIKKLNRIRDELPNLSASKVASKTIDEAIDAICQELADVVCYADLLATRLGRDLESHVVRKFNDVSERYGFPERLP